MKLLTEIKDDDSLDFETCLKKYRYRKAVRGIFVDSCGLIPIIYVSKNKYHKVSGGGIENDESLKSALKREVLEETGCEIDILGEVGKINEMRKKWEFCQTSYCYYGIIKSKGFRKLTDDEIKLGFELKWLKINDAIKEFELDKTDDYAGYYMSKRDLAFLKYYKEFILK
jgi:8-oxo-dGTP diphosphatase